MAGNDKTGKSRKIGTRLTKCAGYRARNNAGHTPKARRVARAAENGAPPTGITGWFVASNGTARPENTSRKKVSRRSTTKREG